MPVPVHQVEINGEHKGTPAMKPGQLAIHYMKHHKDDACATGANWPTAAKFKQNVVVGCGDIGEPSPGHDPVKQWADMYDAWAYYGSQGKDVVLGQVS